MKIQEDQEVREKAMELKKKLEEYHEKVVSLRGGPGILKRCWSTSRKPMRSVRKPMEAQKFRNSCRMAQRSMKNSNQPWGEIKTDK